MNYGSILKNCTFPFFSDTNLGTKKKEYCKFGFLNHPQYKNMDSFELLIQNTTS